MKLGVGKNMVNAIRYWGLAFKILEQKANPDDPDAADSPQRFRDKLLGDDGWDPFLEDPASLWLLHWKLLQPEVSRASLVGCVQRLHRHPVQRVPAHHACRGAGRRGRLARGSRGVSEEGRRLPDPHVHGPRHGTSEPRRHPGLPIPRTGLMEAAVGEEGPQLALRCWGEAWLDDEIVAHAALDFAAAVR